MKTPICIDFESEAIESRPKYPPVPVGLAIKWPGRKAKYIAWGHPGDDPSKRAEAEQALREVWASGDAVLMHNAKFDLDVAETHFGLKPLPWERVHDTLFTLFLHDPHAASLSLKPSAERYLGMPPDERDAVRDWLVDHGVIASNGSPGAFIARAPSSVVAPYAIGDVERTLALHKLLWPKLDRRMREAYDRERRLLPIMLENERQGIRVDVEGLARDLATYEAALVNVEAWLRKRLKRPSLDFEQDKEVGDALFENKIVTNWVWTKGGNGRAPQRSIAKDNLTIDRFDDQQVGRRLAYRTKLHTVVSQSMRPWLAMAQAPEAKSRIFTEWNQVRHHEHGKKSRGARSGRMSCSRFMNVSKAWEGKEDRYEHPTDNPKLPPLPLVRNYLLPDEGHEWGHLDYRQQEFHIVAHYEDGDLKDAYNRDPSLDYHDQVATMVKSATGVDFDRRTIKAVNFGILYGEGKDLLALKLGLSVAEAMRLKAAVQAATPGVEALNTYLKEQSRAGEPIRTWGGRLYYCEPPAVAKKGVRKGQMISFEYKLLNYLAQGSAADVTKEAIIRYHEVQKDGRMVVTVHDEINISAPKGALVAEDRRLAQAMESIEMDVFMSTDEKRGPNWGSLEKVK
jgi:DNA polymerase-1